MIELPDNVNPEVIVEFTQRARLDLYQENAEDKKFSFALLNALSVTALATMKLNIDETNATTDKEVSAALSGILRNVNENPFIFMGSNKPIEEPEITMDIIINPEETSTILADFELKDF
jgi:uncharacterized protein YpiB (UPF0302 family)